MRGGTNSTATIPIKTTIIEGTLASSASAWSSEYALPKSWTDRSKIYILKTETYYVSGSDWRSEGQGARSSSFYRCFAAITSSNTVKVYNTLSSITGGSFRVHLMYLG